MSEFQFDEPKVNNFPQKETPAFIALLLRYGVVKNKEQASYVLLAIAVLGILFTIYMVVSLTGEEEVPERYQYDEEAYDPALDPEESR